MKGLPTGMSKPQQPVLGGKAQLPPGTAMKRPIGTASGARPTTAVSAAGFSSMKNSMSGVVGGDPNASMTITLEPKIET